MGKRGEPWERVLTVAPTTDRAETTDEESVKAFINIRSIAIGYSGDSAATPVRKGQCKVSADIISGAISAAVARTQGYLNRGRDPFEMVDTILIPGDKLLLRVWNSYTAATLEVRAVFRGLYL